MTTSSEGHVRHAEVIYGRLHQFRFFLTCDQHITDKHNTHPLVILAAGEFAAMVVVILQSRFAREP